MHYSTDRITQSWGSCAAAHTSSLCKSGFGEYHNDGNNSNNNIDNITSYINGRNIFSVIFSFGNFVKKKIFNMNSNLYAFLCMKTPAICPCIIVFNILLSSTKSLKEFIIISFFFHLVISFTQEFEFLCLLVHKDSIEMSGLGRSDLYCLVAPPHYLTCADISWNTEWTNIYIKIALILKQIN